MGPHTSVEGVFKNHDAAEKWVMDQIEDHESWVPYEEKNDKVTCWVSQYHGAEFKLEKWKVDK